MIPPSNSFGESTIDASWEAQDAERQKRQSIKVLLKTNHDKRLSDITTSRTENAGMLKELQARGITTGKDTVTFRNSDTYTGELVKGLPHGTGKHIRFRDGRIYEGEFRGGQEHGQGVVYDKKGREVYVGSWKEGLRHGRGKSRESIGRYEGSWRQGVMQGQGTLTFNDHTTYVGGFDAGQFEDNGTLTYPNGDSYTGYWLDGMHHGHGTLRFKATGDYYEGAWWRGQKQGAGKYKCTDFTYEGEWRADMMSGYGSYYYANGDRYVGEWVNDHENGYGKYTFSDGGCYEGDWKDGDREGKGLYYYGSKEKYEGEWVENFKHGHGKYLYASGAIYDGSWEDDLPHGKGTYSYPSGRVYDVVFEVGALQSKVLVSGPSVQHNEAPTTTTTTTTTSSTKKSNIIHSDAPLTAVAPPLSNLNAMNSMSISQPLAGGESPKQRNSTKTRQLLKMFISGSESTFCDDPTSSASQITIDPSSSRGHGVPSPHNVRFRELPDIALFNKSDPAMSVDVQMHASPRESKRGSNSSSDAAAETFRLSQMDFFDWNDTMNLSVQNVQDKAKQRTTSKQSINVEYDKYYRWKSAVAALKLTKLLSRGSGPPK